MKPNLLRAPVIKSAVFLAFVCLVVYFTLTTPGGSVWCAIGSIFTLAIAALQWGLGMVLGILACLAVLIGIFLGAVAMTDQAAASRMYESLRGWILAVFQPLAAKCSCSRRKDTYREQLDALGSEVRGDCAELVGTARKELVAAQGELAQQVEALQGRIAGVAETAESRLTAADLEEITEEIARLGETLSTAEGALKDMQAKVEQALKEAAKTPEIDSAALLGDLPARVEQLEAREIPAPVDLSGLEQGMATLQKEIAALNSVVEREVSGLKSGLDEVRKAQEEAAAAQSAPAPAESKAEKPAPKKAEKKAEKRPAKKAAAKKTAKKKADPLTEHRLLSYFDNEEDRSKLAGLVAETLKKDMTYAQVTEYLIKNMGAQGEVISGHPSLAKDYIRQCRRNS